MKELVSFAPDSVDAASENEVLEIFHVQHAAYDAGVSVEAKVFGSHSDLKKFKVGKRTKGSANEPASLCRNVVQVEVQRKELQLWHGF